MFTITLIFVKIISDVGVWIETGFITFFVEYIALFKNKIGFAF